MKELTGTLVIGGGQTTSGTFVRLEDAKDEIDMEYKAEIDELYCNKYPNGLDKTTYSTKVSAIINEMPGCIGQVKFMEVEEWN